MNDQDIDTLARWTLRWAFEAWAEDHGWEDVPEIGEHDYEAIIKRASELLPEDVTLVEFIEAKERLANQSK